MNNSFSPGIPGTWDGFLQSGYKFDGEYALCISVDAANNRKVFRLANGELKVTKLLHPITEVPLLEAQRACEAARL